MSIEHLHPDPLIDALVADLGRVQPRRPWREVALIGALLLVELLLFAVLRDVRPDLAAAMHTPVFWWKLAAFAVIAGLAVAAMLASLDPAQTSQRRMARLWQALAVVAPVALALGWLIDAGVSGRAALSARLEWREGVDCLINVGLLSLPLMLVLGLLARRGAATRPAQMAAAAGLAAAAFGAVIFAVHCPHDDPLYVAVWYGGAVALVTGLTRWLLPPLTRW